MFVRGWIWVAATGILILPMVASGVSYSGTLTYTPPPPAGAGDTATIFANAKDWADYELTIGYEATDEDGSFPGFPWRYTYTFALVNPDAPPDPKGGISHIVLETSTSFTEANLTGLSGASLAGDDPIKTQTVGSGNPQMPEDVYGIRFDPLSADLTTMTWSFFSNRSPIWGDIYVKDGGKPGEENAAWNSGFTSPDSDPAGFPFVLSDNHVLVPDTNLTSQPPGGHVPEPVTALGVLAGLGGLAGYCRRRFA